jgi:nitrate/TMAO reductase-like tetraheme cytochrome c subunit
MKPVVQPRRRWGAPDRIARACLALAFPTLGACRTPPGASAPDVDASAAAIEAMFDPQTCRGCHPTQYGEWARSVHASASDDPIFIAMNQRGQRETGGQLGPFCVQCHAPMAVREGKTSDGTNLSSLEPKYHGVTCYFCHTVSSVAGTHNAALVSSRALVMYGDYSDTTSNGAHRSEYAAIFDRHLPESSQLCGGCHDVVSPPGAAIERTFCEWAHSAFDQPYSNGGQSCATCHMNERQAPIAALPGAPVRAYHEHDWPAVDVPFGADGGVTDQVKTLLASTFQGALCVTAGGGIRVILDPVLTGHRWPSGAAQDRRAWTEIIAYEGSSVVYQSGVVPDGTAVTELRNDPDLWLLREQMYGSSGGPVTMFWQAAATSSNALPALATFDPTNPAYYANHVEQFFPRAGDAQPTSLSQVPDRVTLRLRLQPVGSDVLADLVDGGDLDPAIAAEQPTYDVSFLTADGGVQPALEWTPQSTTAQYVDDFDQTIATCVSTLDFNVAATKVPAAGAQPVNDCPGPVEGGAPDGAANDVDAGVDGGANVCDPQFTPDTIAPGLVKTGTGGALRFKVLSADSTPPVASYNTWVVEILDPTGQPAAGASLTAVKTWMPLHGHPSSVGPTWTQNADGTFSTKVYLFMPGVWQVTLTATAGTTTDSATFSFCAGG